MSMDTRVQLENNSWIEMFQLSDDIAATEADFKELLSMKPKERGKVIVFGKEFDVPRWQKSFGESYRFSGLEHKAGKIESGTYLERLLNWVRKTTNLNYSQALINWYINGTEYIGSHSDDMSQLVANSSILSFSFGATRDFVIKSKTDKKFRLCIPLKNNTCVVMGGQMQKHYKHEVPKRLKVKEPRINITFRLYK
jgi:alkylated DNA repair dioxygenase AlkB